MGRPYHWIGITQEIRRKIGKNPGDTVHVVIREDLAPRVVEIPHDLKILLDKNLEVKDFFHRLSFSHQKEYVKWITGAKKPETRSRRLDKTIQMLKKKMKRP
jgi:hypothetical protein